MTITVAERSKARVCCGSHAGISGSNLARSVEVCFLRDLCVVRLRLLRGTDPSSRGVLLTVACHDVWSINFRNEAARTLVGLLREKEYY